MDYYIGRGRAETRGGEVLGKGQMFRVTLWTQVVQTGCTVQELAEVVQAVWASGPQCLRVIAAQAGAVQKGVFKLEAGTGSLGVLTPLHQGPHLLGESQKPNCPAWPRQCPYCLTPLLTLKGKGIPLWV
ncbi:hypothetical protein P7K49_029881 [Saguinus oedipus]|uniref:Uncharacterized protein n=1 Tax=Saguinus oedipus TaxID=9490 RepID=A0ABQ9UAH8_SAGOE|nr:hypothetical protein P7K49_029881 [Saguinus oedipus]